MPRNLKTGWKRIGRSGPTVDGRNIDSEHLRQAAESYDPKLFTALIWPDHRRWYNMGKIEALRADDNDESGVDLFAIILPNEIYLNANKYGQQLFTSMELLEDFRGSGETYLTGLGATDNPASAGTTEMRFSRVADQKTLMAEHVEHVESADFETEDDQPPSWFSKYFSKTDPETDDMDKKTLELMQTQLAGLTEKFTALSVAAKPEGEEQEGAKTEAEKFTALSDQVTALTEKFTAMETKLAEKPSDDGDQAKQYTELKTALDDLTDKFKAATKEQGGTDAGEEAGGDDLSGCL